MDRQSLNTKSMVLPFPLNFDNDKYLEMYKSFNKIMVLARDLNTQIDVPEFIFLGRGKSGRSTLIEGLVGLPMGISTSTSRPVAITMVNNLSYERPVVTVKRDKALAGFEMDKAIAVEDIAGEVAKRNIKSTVPVQIQIEYKYCLNMVLVEPPALPADLKALSSPSDLEGLAIQFSKSGDDHKTLVIVDRVGTGALVDADLVDLAKKLDPKLDRTMFVGNHFAQLLAGFSSSKDLNKYLQENTKPTCFYVTLPEADGRNVRTKEDLKAQVEALAKKDSDVLENLQYDKKYQRQVGMPSFVHFVSEVTWKRYQEVIPEVLKRLRSFKKNSSEGLARLKSQISALEEGNGHLRVVASNYVMEFLQNIDKLVVGTLEGNPTMNGQTLVEEKAQEETGEWIDHNHRVLDNPSKRVQYHDSKLYGGQQFERALSEFRAISEVVELGDLTVDEIASALGTQRPGNVSSLAWAASDIAQKKSKELLVPLIDQLFRRQSYVLCRLADIVDKMIENKRKVTLRRQNDSNTSAVNQYSGTGDLIQVDDHPYFVHAIKEMYFKFVFDVSAACKTKCMDEFYTTRLIYWELNNNKDLKKLSESPVQVNTKTSAGNGEMMATVAQLASKLFQDIRNRIVKNVMLKCYDFFLIPMQNDLRKEIQGKITVLSDKTLNELFEVPVTKERLSHDEKHLTQINNQFQQQEENFLVASNVFSYPFKNLPAITSN